jgi:hypothetical protein
MITVIVTIAFMVNLLRVNIRFRCLLANLLEESLDSGSVNLIVFNDSLRGLEVRRCCLMIAEDLMGFGASKITR